MARPLRIQYHGAVYHVTCRGNERKQIYSDDGDRQTFLKKLAESLKIYTVNLFSYVLMGNHFHLLVETPLGNLGEFMRQFNITYTSYYNRRHNRVGHLYQGRYKSIIVDKENYLSVLSRYIHLNPVRMKEMKDKTPKEKMDYLIQYPWSSLPDYLFINSREGFIDYEMVLNEYGGDNERGRKNYQERIYKDLSNGLTIHDRIKGQSILGEEGFIEWIRDRFLKGKVDRECPPLRQLQQYKSGEQIFASITRVSGQSMDEILTKRNPLKYLTMDLLCRIGGLKEREVGRILKMDYSTVSVGRKRHRERMKGDEKLRMVAQSIERELSILKN
ncbi:MAG: transposase [Thermodesulfovibrionales bacterium]|nr:transposase [Thermodesulfovibrionales bacterium]